MKITYDPEANAYYIYLNTRVKKTTTEELDSVYGVDLLIDKSVDGEVVGIEIIGTGAPEIKYL